MTKRRVLQMFAIAITLAALAGCQAGNQSSNETAESNTPATEGSKSAPALRHRSESGGTSSQPSAQPRMESVTAPAGTELPVVLTTALDTGTTSPGSNFEGSLAEPLVVNGVQVAASGSKVVGKVTNVSSSGRLHHPAELSLVLTSLTPEGGSEMQISTRAWGMRGKSHKKRNAILIGGGAGLGAAIGAIAGGGKGAAIGGAAGAGAGTAGAYATGKDEIRLAPESRLNFRLSAPVTFNVSKSS